MVIFGGGGRRTLLRGLHVTCDTHLRTCPSYFRQTTCVKIWFGLLEPFKSYRGNRQKKKITDATGNNTLEIFSGGNNNNNINIEWLARNSLSLSLSLSSLSLSLSLFLILLSFYCNFIHIYKCMYLQHASVYAYIYVLMFS